MARYLVTFNDNHGDEFDVNGFTIMTDREVDEFEELASSITWEFVFYANTESLNFSNGEDFLSRIEYKEIDKDQYAVLEKIFGGEFGTFISTEYLQTILDGAAELDAEDFDENED